MPVLSLNFRTALFSEQSEEVPVALVRLTHPDWELPVRLSTDPTERLSDDPLQYGTRSTWRTEPAALMSFFFVLMSVSLPDKSEDSPPSTSLIFENVDRDMAQVLLSIDPWMRRELSVDLALTLASQPNVIEEEYRDLRAVASTITDDRVTLQISRVPILSEPCPADRMTPSRFPGLFR